MNVHSKAPLGRPNRLQVEIYNPCDAEASSSRDCHWVTITGEGGCELTIWCQSADQAQRVADAINTPTVLIDDAEHRDGLDARVA